MTHEGGKRSIIWTSQGTVICHVACWPYQGFGDVSITWQRIIGRGEVVAHFDPEQTQHWAKVFSQKPRLFYSGMLLVCFLPLGRSSLWFCRFYPFLNSPHEDKKETRRFMGIYSISVTILGTPPAPLEELPFKELPPLSQQSAGWPSPTWTTSKHKHQTLKIWLHLSIPLVSEDF